MARKKIREYDSKRLLKEHLKRLAAIDLQICSAQVTESTDFTELTNKEPWLSSAKLVVKPDMLFGKRGKSGLVALNLDLAQVAEFVKGRLGVEVEMGGCKAPITTFIIEPFIPHDQEYYLSIVSERLGCTISFSECGGIEIEENWDKVKTVFLPTEKPMTLEACAPLIAILPLEVRPKIGDFIIGVFSVFKDLDFSFLEMNPFTLVNGEPYPLDMRGELDDTAAIAVSSVVFTGLAVVVCAAGAIVVGLPILFIPLPSVAGFYLARFFTKKSLPSYFTFVVLGSLMVTWFVLHNFWDLNIWLAGMSLKSFCKLIVASVTLTMVVPGLALLPAKLHVFTEAGLICHALLLCYIENCLFNYSSIYYYGLEDDVMYPSYMVVMTTFVGLALVRRLSVDHRIGPKAIWILICLYSSKLGMLFMSSKSVLWVSAVLLLAVSPPLLLYKGESRTASKMKPWQGYAHAGVVALSVWFCSETIFEAIQWWNGRPPSDGLLLGFCILLMGLACVPIVALHFSHSMPAKRCLVLVVATGLLFILMQPPIPLSWTYNSEVIKAARQSTDDISIYGFMASKPTWPSWLLIAAVLLTLAAFMSIIPIKYIVELKTFYSIAMGIALGIYISAEYFLQAAILHALIVVTMVCASVFVVFTHFPSASSTKVLPWVFALLVALFPVTYLLEGQVRVKSVFAESEVGDAGEDGSKLTALLAVEGARTSLLGLYAAIFMLIALEIKFELASLMREKVMQRSGLRHSQSGQSSSASFPPKLRFMQQRRASTVSAFTIKRMSAEGAWMPAVGNVATVMCFAICLILNVNLTDSSNRAIFFLAPILLLLNQDSDFVAGFGDKQRYFPVTVVISAYLVLTALYSIWEDIWHGSAGWGLEIGGPDWFFAVKNVALLILTFPSHILFNRFVWCYSRQTDSTPLLTIPLNLPPVIITDVIKIKILGLLGIIYSLAQYLISRQQYISGLKYI